MAAQLHLGLEAAHKGAVGHALLGEVLELVQDDLPVHHYKALHMVRLQAQIQEASTSKDKLGHFKELYNGLRW